MFRSPRSRDAACCWLISRLLPSLFPCLRFLTFICSSSFNCPPHPALSQTHALEPSGFPPLWCVYLQRNKHGFKVLQHRLIICKVKLFNWAALCFFLSSPPTSRFFNCCLTFEVSNLFRKLSWHQSVFERGGGKHKRGSRKTLRNTLDNCV